MLQLLESIYEGNDLSVEQAEDSFEELLTGKLDMTLTTAMLTALKTKGESINEIAGAAKALRGQAIKFPSTSYPVSDCCGTGGDGLNTINVSTLVSFVAASMGIKVVKHGNRSVSSQCGSSDLIGALGINVHMSPEKSKAMLDKTNFSFLFAPDYHLGVKHVMPVRQKLKTRTIFNLIGPLANPALPEYQLLGVYDEKYCGPFAQILNLLGTKRALVVNGSGLDEIAVHDKTKAALLNNGKVTLLELQPEELGVNKHTISDIQVSSLEDNVEAGIAVLKGTAPEAHVDMVAANCGALLFLNDRSKSIKDGFEMAKSKILSGEVYQYMNHIKELSNA